MSEHGLSMAPPPNAGKFSLREQFLVLGLALTVGLMGYGMLRLAPLSRELTVLSEEAESARAKAAGLKLPREPVENAQSLADELARTEQQLASLRVRLAERESRFANPASAEAMQRIKVDIAALADASRVAVQRSTPIPPPKPESLKAQGPLAALLARYPRPLYHYELSGTHSGLRYFLRGLESLPQQVGVLAFRLEVADAKTAEGRKRLNARLWLAL